MGTGHYSWISTVHDRRTWEEAEEICSFIEEWTLMGYEIGIRHLGNRYQIHVRASVRGCRSVNTLCEDDDLYCCMRTVRSRKKEFIGMVMEEVDRVMLEKSKK